ncbi:alpha/beta hydrolase [Arthrobacter sp. NicSoilB8]|uniref:alpha/beta fold hydrolase n=1 Tax=Arthrobacter sp. NicSoilB8 TaxID=2830998 RepID=UPI001CC7AEF1|nr:alpha/beta hydrolase [Arthrobacter sp. NicSoilB8]BCW71607.1 alpha/beta hydrolase [Arthrobacter sp. NicSoilB8]
MGVVALSVTGLLLASTGMNLILEQTEKSGAAAYGEKVRISGGTVNVTRTGNAGPTIVLLSGLGTPAPGLDFAPLIRELGGYQVIAVEGFGYGYSDMAARPRTIENISEELHEVLARLEIKAPYTLIGHSLAGLSTLYYANKYPGEVSAVIGIDPTVPSSKASTSGSTAPSEAAAADYSWAHIPSTTGLVRWATALGYGEPGGDSFTPAERQHMRQMTSWNFGNQAVTDDTFRVGENAAKLRDVRYPDTLPVLDFLSRDTMKEQPDWFGAHERQLANVKRHELVVLEGDHYLHWTQSKAMATKIREFLGPGSPPLP